MCNIISGGVGEMNVYFGGYYGDHEDSFYSIKNVVINCTNGDICNIFCITNSSCSHMSIIGCNNNCTINQYILPNVCTVCTLG